MMLDSNSHVRKYLWKEMFWSKSFCLLTTGGAPIEVIKKYIEEQKVNGIVKSATISRNGSGKYFISLLCETDIEKLPKTNSAIGIDLGIKDIAILSTGEKVQNLKFRKQLERKLKRYAQHVEIAMVKKNWCDSSSSYDLSYCA